MPGLAGDDAGNVIYYVIIAAAVSVGVVRLYWGRPLRALRDATIWVALILVIIIGYVFRDEARLLGRRLLAVVIPGYAVVQPDGESVEIVAGADGHFMVRGEVNGEPVTFLADTGATAVVLQYEDAERAGIDTAGLSFTFPVQTANGEALAARINFGEVGVATIRRQNVTGFVAQQGRLDGSLLGMSFLGRLSAIEMRGDKLILRD